MTGPLNPSRRPRRRPAVDSRRGAVTILALAALMIVISIVGSMLEGALRSQRQMHAERDRRQTELLLQAGAERAAARLAEQPDFRGDTWDLPAAAIVGHGTARVTTEVTRSADDQTWQVHVVAEYPLGRDFPIRRSHTFAMNPTVIQSRE